MRILMEVTYTQSLFKNNTILIVSFFFYVCKESYNYYFFNLIISRSRCCVCKKKKATVQSYALRYDCRTQNIEFETIFVVLALKF